MDSIFDSELTARATALLAACRAKALKIVTAESCTGGLVAALLTEIPGSSDVFDRGFVTYSNAAKHQLLGVSETLIDACGAVSPEVARAMADGALTHSKADISVAITGVAGPGGGTEQKPVGLVHFACGRRMSPIKSAEQLFGDIGRIQVRMAALAFALSLMEQALAER
ncbi:MAG: CinA family protein [Beijerinckiaceae bacterium]|nr:CinA family protein [Beijerinckiaceae bacterium]